MKQCPLCGRTYADETLTYCLDDGSLLSTSYDPQATQRLPSPRVTSPAPTEVLPPTETLPAGQHHVQPRHKGTPWFIYALIALASVAVGGGVVMLLSSGGKNNRQPDSSTFNARQISTSVSQGNISSGNENKQNGETSSNTTAAPAGGGKESPSPSGDVPPSQKLVGVWRTRVSEHGRKYDITLTLKADGASKYSFTEGRQRGTAYGSWRYSDGVLYEVFQDGSSGKGAVRWVDDDTLELTIIDNGVPAYTGLKRVYRRAG